VHPRGGPACHRVMSANYPAEFLAATVIRLRNEGMQTTFEAGALRIKSLGCRIRCSRAQGESHPRVIPLRVTLEHEAFARPIEDELAAVGSNRDAAIADAAAAWISDFLRPFESFAEGSPGVHTSPLQGTPLFAQLLPALAAVLADGQAHALKCALHKEPGRVHLPGDRLFATCHLDNHAWADGLEVLHAIGDGWGEVAWSRTVRQWFFFRPEPLAQPSIRSMVARGVPARPP
jgi:hypothetical protein